MTRKINVYRLLRLILIAGMGAQSYKINTLQYYLVDNAVECIGKAGKMTQEDLDYCRSLLLKLGLKENKSST